MIFYQHLWAWILHKPNITAFFDTMMLSRWCYAFPLVVDARVVPFIFDCSLSRMVGRSTIHLLQ